MNNKPYQPTFDLTAKSTVEWLLNTSTRSLRLVKKNLTFLLSKHASMACSSACVCCQKLLTLLPLNGEVDIVKNLSLVCSVGPSVVMCMHYQ